MLVILVILLMSIAESCHGDTAGPGIPTGRMSTEESVEILRAMDICGNNLSDARKQILTQQILRITSIYLPRPEHRQAYVGLLCIESRFDSGARSKVGAVGISQLMPKFAPYFAEQCNLGTISTEDLSDTEINLTLGACHFSKLLEALDGSVALALSGYNSGQDSETTRRLAKLAEGHPETMAYIAKFYTFLDKLNHDKKNRSK